jgi:hypothetical protein
METIKGKIAEFQTYNGRNRERDLKERYENFIQIIKGKVEETTPKRKNKNYLGNGGQGNIGNTEKQPGCMWSNRECNKVI